MTQKANDHQVAGNHYSKTPLQHWDLAALYGWDYFQSRTIAYIMRWRDKGGIQDLEKARHFMDKYIEVETMRNKGTLTRDILKAALALLDEPDYNVNGDAPSEPRPVSVPTAAMPAQVPSHKRY